MPRAPALAGGWWLTGASSLRDSGRPYQRPFQASSVKSARRPEMLQGAEAHCRTGDAWSSPAFPVAAVPPMSQLDSLPGFTGSGWGPTQLQPWPVPLGPTLPPAGTEGSVPWRMGLQSTREQPPAAAGRSAGGGAAWPGARGRTPCRSSSSASGHSQAGGVPALGARGAIPSWEQHRCWHSPAGPRCAVTTAEVPVASTG